MSKKAQPRKITKKLGRPPEKDEAKKSYNVYLQPKDKDAIVKEHGSLTAAIETTIPKKQPKLTTPKKKS